MKRFIAVLSGLLVLPAFAEVAPIYYDEIYETVDEVSADETASAPEQEQVAAPVVQPSRVGPRGTTSSGRAVSRALPAAAATTATNVSKRTAAAGRVTPSSRTATNQRVTARTATSSGVAARGAVSRSATRPSVRSVSNGAEQIAVTRRAMQGENTAATNTARAGITQTDTVNTPLYTGRVAMRSSSAVRARIPSVATGISGTSTVSSAAVEETAVSMDELAQVTDFCKAQYMQCMDNYCNVLDENQGRCSCSKNLKNYAKTEEALKAATEALQDVAQQIQYIGLSADEVETLFTQTIAEDTMQSSSDNTQLKNDLDKIKKLIVDVKAGSASSAENTSGLSFDLSGLLDFSVDSSGFDLSSLFGGTQSNTNSISNQRGEQLYKTATARCKTAVLTDCQAQGVDISIITNAYDLEIDKQCLAYERNLTDGNEEMSRTVRNAKGVLQRARLMVAQQKNVYDLRGCVSALDSCMQDDFVCGTDYENCLDPTGKYIVNGEIVIGSTPGQKISPDTNTLAPDYYYTDGVYATWNYGATKPENNAWADNGSLSEYINATVDSAMPVATDKILSKFLLHKIGYNQDGKNYGMCMSVLNKCQDITYSDGTYQADNNVIKEYLQRTLVQIKTMQDNIVAEHAENCLSDVSSCLSQNSFTVSENIAINACRQQIKTCMSVNGNVLSEPTPTDMKEWVNKFINGEKVDETPPTTNSTNGTNPSYNQTGTPDLS